LNRASQPLDEDQKLQLCLERDRLLCDPEFERSPIMSKLLRFLVDHRLSHNPLPLKAYTIAVDALGREDSFDTGTDSYPRVQMSRLRKILNNFYLREGGKHRLSIPRNDYEIVIVSNTVAAASLLQLPAGDMIGIEAPTGEPDLEHISSSLMGQHLNLWGWSRLKVGILIAVAGIVLTMVGGYFLFLLPPQKEVAYPAIIVADTSGIVNEETKTVAESTKAHFITSLGRFDQLQVLSRKGAKPSSKLYTLESNILDEEAKMIQFQLISNSSGELIWSEQSVLFSRKELDSKLSSIVIDIAGPYGVIGQAELSKYRGDFTPGYPCILQFHEFLRYRDMAMVEPVRGCMQKSAMQFPNDSYVLSLLAVAGSILQRFSLDDAIGPSAMDTARRAVQLDSHSASANFAVAHTAFLGGDCDAGVAWGRRAAELNPLNSRIIGYLGLYMHGCKLPESNEWAVRALEMDTNIDSTIAAMLAFQKFKRGDAIGAQKLSQKYMARALRPEPSLELTYILSTALLGDKPEARRLWRNLATRFGHSEHTPVRQVLRSWIASPEMINEIALAFDEIELY